MYLIELIGGKSSGLLISIFCCSTKFNVDKLSWSFPTNFGDLLLEQGDKDDDEFCTCSLSLRLWDKGVTGEGDGVFLGGNTFPLEEFFNPWWGCSTAIFFPLVCEIAAFFGGWAAFWREEKWCDVCSLKKFRRNGASSERFGCVRFSLSLGTPYKFEKTLINADEMANYRRSWSVAQIDYYLLGAWCRFY